MMIVSVWPKGYAEPAGPRKFEVENLEASAQEIGRLAREKFGSFAQVIRATRLTPVTTAQQETFSKEYIAMMSRDS